VTPEPARILIVDDSETNRTLLVRMLKTAGYVPAHATQGREAMAMLTSQAFDLILLDMLMPEMDGFEVLQRLKADPKLRHVPVIIVSAMTEIQDVSRCIALGAEDYLPKPFDPVLLKARITASLDKKRLRDHERLTLQQLEKEKKRSDALLEVVIPIGVALSVERDFDRLLEMILVNAKSLCAADGGTLYLREGETLKFEIARNDTLNITLGGAGGQPPPFAPLRLHDEQGRPNHHSVATHAALTGQTINIADAYSVEGFDFSGTRAFDQANGYRSQSFLTIPLKNPAGEVIGVLQLINAKDPETGAIIPFDKSVQKLVETLSTLATVVLEAYLREQALHARIQELQVVLDQVKVQKQVSEITDTEYFQTLRQRAEQLRRRRKRG
jgi:CheY-like chemotaxis protein